MRMRVATAGVLTWILVLQVAAADPPREAIGEVLGKTVYRDQLPAGLDERDEQAYAEALRKLFVVPLVEQYWAENAGVITPTPEEIAVVASYFDKEHAKRIAPQEKEMRTKLAELDARLRDTTLTEEARRGVSLERGVIEDKLRPPGTPSVEFVLKIWKSQRHVYVTYGGGRVLWQEFGPEAFDATRRCLEDQERQGKLRVCDERLRKLLFAYWTTQEGSPFLTDEPQRIREFLEPAWAPPASTRPASQPATRPATKNGN